MATITMWASAITRASALYADWYTVLMKGNTATWSGLITSIEIWFDGAWFDAHNAIVWTFSGSWTTWTNKDYVILWTIPSWSKQTFSWLHLAVSTGDTLWLYYHDPANTSAIEATWSPDTYLYTSWSQFWTWTKTYTDLWSGDSGISFYATGDTTLGVSPFPTSFHT